VATNPPAPPPAPGLDARSPRALAAQYSKADYRGVVRVCSATAIKPEISRVCLLAACRQRDAAQAKRWLSGNEPALRDSLVDKCHELGGINIR